MVSTLQYQDLVIRERRAAEALVGITEIRSQMQNAEDALRSYAASAAPTTLESFNRASGVVDRTVARVQRNLDADGYTALRETAEEFAQWRQDFALVAIADALDGNDRVIPEANTEPFRARVADIEQDVRSDLDTLDGRIDTALPISIGSMALAGAAAILTAVLLARRVHRLVARPILELAADTHRLGDGDLTVRSSASGVAEVDDIAGAFNAMAARLEQTVAGLWELDQLKSEFVSMVSHELRTPLTSILGYIDALIVEEPGRLNEEQREYALAVDRNAKRLQALVDDLLTLSRLDGGRLVLQLQPVDVGAIAHATCDDLNSRALEKGVRLSVDAERDLVVDGDTTRLGQVITNLVSNAVKFTPSGGSVHVEARADDGDVVVSVRDEGIGIPADELPRLFERFFRSRNVGSIEGTGLGLAITRQLVELQGGSMSVESEQGAGSTFTVRLPAAQQDQPAATPVR